VFGLPERVPVDEILANPYGAPKLLFEKKSFAGMKSAMDLP
jgi:hypothetical protein